MTHTAPVGDWASDFDVMDPQYVADPFGIWDELPRPCPIAHTDRRKSSWMPALRGRHGDRPRHRALQLAQGGGDPGRRGRGPDADFDGPNLEYGLPPISADPPLHTWTRRLLLPWFSHRRVDSYVPLTRDLCRGCSTASSPRAAPTPPPITPSRSRSG